MRGSGYCKRRLRRGSNPRTYGRPPPVIYKCKYYTARNKYIRALCNVDYIDKVRTDMARNKNIRALYCHITSPLTAHGIKISVLYCHLTSPQTGHGMKISVRYRPLAGYFYSTCSYLILMEFTNTV